jgi:hypothetical protein
MHPNLIPVYCNSQEDIKNLAATMRAAALRDVHEIEGYKGHATEEGAIFAASISDQDELFEQRDCSIGCYGSETYQSGLHCLEEAIRWKTRMASLHEFDGPIRN